MKYAVIVAAGGSGSRFGNSGGKQLYEIDGKPILIITLEQFVGLVDQIIVVIRQEDIPQLQKYCEIFEIPVDAIVAAGAERCDSVRNGLKAVNPDITGVLIHDGARPNVSLELIESLKKALLTQQAVIPVVPVVDTIKVIRDNMVVSTPKRSELYQVQTPQAFHTEIIRSAYAGADVAACTDDAMVVERYGLPVATVPGDRNNIKITNPEDILRL